MDGYIWPSPVIVTVCPSLSLKHLGFFANQTVTVSLKPYTFAIYNSKTFTGKGQSEINLIADNTSSPSSAEIDDMSKLSMSNGGEMTDF